MDMDADILKELCCDVEEDRVVVALKVQVDPLRLRTYFLPKPTQARFPLSFDRSTL